MSKSLPYFLIVFLVLSCLTPRAHGMPSGLFRNTAISFVGSSRQINHAGLRSVLAHFIFALPFLPVIVGVPIIGAVALPGMVAAVDVMNSLVSGLPPPIRQRFNYTSAAFNQRPKLFNKFMDITRWINIKKAKPEEDELQVKLRELDCQRRMVCEVCRTEVGPITATLVGNLFKMLRVHAMVDNPALFPENARLVMTEFLTAAQNGLDRKDCSAIYYHCEDKNLFTSIFS